MMDGSLPSAFCNYAQCNEMLARDATKNQIITVHTFQCETPREEANGTDVGRRGRVEKAWQKEHEIAAGFCET